MFKYLTLRDDKLSSFSMAQKFLIAFAASLVITISAKISIPLYPVPTTMHTLAVLLLGCVLGPRMAAMSVTLYLAQALAGLPVLQGPVAGPVVMVGPTGGYLLGFVVATYMTGALYQKGMGRSFVSAIALLTIGAICIDIPGVAWLTFLTNFDVAKAAFLSYQIPFIFKTGLGAAILVAMARHSLHQHHHHSHRDS